MIVSVLLPPGTRYICPDIPLWVHTLSFIRISGVYTVYLRSVIHFFLQILHGGGNQWYDSVVQRSGFASLFLFGRNCGSSGNSLGNVDKEVN